MANYPSTALTTDLLHTAVNNLETVLDGDITDSDTTITVLTTVNFPSVGAITIDAERIAYTGTTATSFTGCTRGFGGTSAVAHFDGTTVEFTYGAEFHNDVRDEVIAIGNDLRSRIGTDTAKISSIGDVELPLNSKLALSGFTSDYFLQFAAGVVNLNSGGNIISNVPTAYNHIWRINGVEIGRFEQNGYLLLKAAGSATSPALTLGDDTNTGLYKSGADILDFTRAGTHSLSIDSFGTRIKAGQMLTQDGSVTAPGMSFENDSNTGLYRSAVDQLTIAASGIPVCSFNSSNVISAFPFTAPDGSASAPSFRFTNDLDTGMYYSSGLRLAFAGSQVARFNSTSVFFDNPIHAANGSASSPSYSFLNDTDTGIYWSSSGDVRITSNGTDRLLVRTSDITVNNTILPSVDNGADIGSTSFGWRTYFSGDGSVGTPAFTFKNDPDTGFYRDTSDNIKMALGGVGEYIFGQTGFVPFTDNTNSCGGGSNRWTAVYAVNGTIQTSHSSTKENIVEVSASIPLPKAVEFDRDGRRYLGYLNDDVPVTGRPILENGEVDTKSNYEQAVIGILCAHIKNLEDRVAVLEE